MGLLKGGCLSLFLAYDLFLHHKEANSHWEFKARVNCTYHPFVTDVNQKALFIHTSWKTSKPLVFQFEKEMKTSKKLWWLFTLQMEQVFLLQAFWGDPEHILAGKPEWFQQKSLVSISDLQLREHLLVSLPDHRPTLVCPRSDQNSFIFPDMYLSLSRRTLFLYRFGWSWRGYSATSSLST